MASMLPPVGVVICRRRAVVAHSKEELMSDVLRKVVRRSVGAAYYFFQLK